MKKIIVIIQSAAIVALIVSNIIGLRVNQQLNAYYQNGLDWSIHVIQERNSEISDLQKQLTTYSGWALEMDKATEDSLYKNGCGSFNKDGSFHVDNMFLSTSDDSPKLSCNGKQIGADFKHTIDGPTIFVDASSSYGPYVPFIDPGSKYIPLL